MKKNKSFKSDCCKADIKLSNPSPNFLGDNYPSIGTCFCICSKCKEPCNFYIPIRKTWTINPSTKIKKDERKKIKDKIIKKERKEIL